jgi:ribosomal protein L11 methyltransferase
MSVRVTIAATRAQGEAVADMEDLPGIRGNPPVLVADEPDPDKADDWLIHAYFDRPPSADDLAAITALGHGEPKVEALEDADWVSMSQAGLQPIRAGRFFVHTPMYRSAPPGTVAFEIDAGLAFGTGQHATTAGCLEALDRLQRDGKSFANIADIGTGTGLLAFAALALWPDARCIATDIDQIAVDVSRDNSMINHLPLGHGKGELLLAAADGMDSPLLQARAPFDLLIANILAGPLIELATEFTRAVAPGGTIVLAGLLVSQADAVAATYDALGCTVQDRGTGEWPVLLLNSGRRAGRA